MSNLLNDYYGLIILTILLLVILFFPLMTNKEFRCKCKESFISRIQPLEGAEYPKSDETPILDSYPYTKYKVIDKNNYSSNWRHYPVFSVGSYEQITNNLKYYKNPDNGLCAPAELCGDFYRDVYTKSNIIKPLPSVQDDPTKIRVNYYNTSYGLLI